MKKVPFGVWPGAWGLSGNTRKRAEIEYYYDGEERDRKLVELDFSGTTLQLKNLELDFKYGKIGSEQEYEEKKAEIEIQDAEKLALRRLDLDFKYKKLDEYAYELKKAEIEIKDAGKRAVKCLELALQFGKMSQTDFDHKMADINEEPWVAVKNSTFDPKLKLNGLKIELDYNDHFVKSLEENGYAGRNPDEVVEAWFNDLCRSIASEEEFMTEDNLLPMKRTQPLEERFVRKTKLDSEIAKYE